MIAAQTANPPAFLPRLRPFGRALVVIAALVAAAMAIWTLGAPGAHAASAPAPANFLSNLDDIPLMPGLSERKDLAVSFDKPEGRIVEATAEGRLGAAEVAKFYATTLPQLGWKGQGNNRFAREGEELHLGFTTAANRLTVRFSLSPRR
jgi:hypothetical protein